MRFFYFLLLLTALVAAVASECGGDDRKVQGCDNSCRRNCANKDLTEEQKNQICPFPKCVATACQCGGNYYYSNPAGDCVLYSHCP